MTQRLPDKPSELIRLGLEDLDRAKRAGYEISMADWHLPISDPSAGSKQCLVCMAGAVMACTLDAPATDDLTPLDYDKDTQLKLRAINYLRSGNLESAFTVMSLPRPESVPRFVQVARYDSNPILFECDMRAMADQLEKAGV